MPNWTFNELKVETTEWLYKDDTEKKEAKKQLDNFIESSVKKEEEELSEKGEERVFSFEGVLPMPKELQISAPAHTEEDKKQEEKNLKKYGAKNWYDWCNMRWGTKWDACNSRVVEEVLSDEWDYDKYIQLYFETAWCPPCEYLEEATKKYPLLRFTCEVEEESNAFLGNLIGQWGQLVDNTRNVEYPTREE